ncbi:cytochrome P450 [Streptomyces erythrochromogenes]|uniref:cytochrome P450 n=1 Tax=Streptomyces erythrochromogenes TaxID=285574 RepID=UPI00068DCA70|nr:cytochrome P450 [Streptomyces erythrochromogenes]
MPLEDEPRFHHWFETALNAWEYRPETASEEFQSRLATGNQAVQDFGRFAAELYDRYAEQPGPGMLWAMVNEDGPEGRMSKGLLTGNALLRHPDALEQLRRRPELTVPGVEELLRFESSVQFWPTRSAAEGIDIAGTTVPKGAPIFLAYGSANRDPEQFTEPDELDLERRDNQHLGFSQGIHFCFGAPLARLEVQNPVGEFVRRVENPRLVEDPPPYRRNQIFRGPRQVLVDIDGIRNCPIRRGGSGRPGSERGETRRPDRSSPRPCPPPRRGARHRTSTPGRHCRAAPHRGLPCRRPPTRRAPEVFGAVRRPRVRRLGRGAYRPAQPPVPLHA